MLPKGNPYQSRDPLHKVDFSTPKGMPQKLEKLVEKPAETKSIFDIRKEGLLPKEVKDKFVRGMTEFQTKLNSNERLELAEDLARSYGTQLKHVTKLERKEKKEASLGEHTQDKLDATHRLNALKIFENMKIKRKK